MLRRAEVSRPDRFSFSEFSCFVEAPRAFPFSFSESSCFVEAPCAFTFRDGADIITLHAAMIGKTMITLSHLIRMILLLSRKRRLRKEAAGARILNNGHACPSGMTS